MAARSRQNSEDYILKKFLVFGILFGLCFPLIALSVDIVHKDLSFSLSDIIQIHILNPIHFIIDLAPLILGATAYGIGLIVKKREAITQSQLVEQVESMEHILNCVQEVSKGEYGTSLDHIADDKMRSSLEALSHHLKDTQEGQRQRNWRAEGTENLVKILRSDQKNIWDQVISFLVNYLQANQGGLYVVEKSDDNIQLRLEACYAYQRKKYIDQVILPGEGLVGQSYLERDYIYMTDIPQHYVKITSGLGEATPTSLLIVPLKVNEEITGVLELASFQTFPSHIISWVQELGELIASQLQRNAVMQQTQHLLNISQKQAEELQAVEEEMRQQMEELLAIQETSKLKEIKTKLIFESSTEAIISFDKEGIIDLCNPAAERLLGYASTTISGAHINVIFPGIDINTQINQHLSVEARLKNSTYLPLSLQLTSRTVGAHVIYIAILQAQQEAPQVLY